MLSTTNNPSSSKPNDILYTMKSVVSTPSNPETSYRLSVNIFVQSQTNNKIVDRMEPLNEPELFLKWLAILKQRI